MGLALIIRGVLVKRPFFPHPQQGKAISSLLGLALFFALFILGCGGGDEAVVEETVTEQQGTLVCSQACSDRGQCGTPVNGDQPVILGHPDFPAVQNQQMIFLADSTLPIIGSKEELLQVVATDEQFNHTFFLVKRTDERVGWVPGWCINPQ